MYSFNPVGLFHAEDVEISSVRLRNDDFEMRLRIRLMCLLLGDGCLCLKAGFELRSEALLFGNDSFAGS